MDARVGGDLLTSRLVEGRLELVVAGAWTVERAAEIERLVNDIAGGAATTDARIDLGRLERLDTYGAWLIERLVRATTTAGRPPEITGLDPAWSDLIDEVRGANLQPPQPAAARRPFGAAVAMAGRGAGILVEDLIGLADMLGRTIGAFGRAVARPATFRLTSVVHHLDKTGLRALPIVLLITFLIGAIIGQQGIFHFGRFGADVFTVDMLGILVLREIGVLIVSIMIAGRSGSAYTAELGSMRMREEVDALRTMGFDPVEVLILPRILALLIALPILTFLGSLSALTGGGLVAWLYGGIPPDIFLDRLKSAISIDHFTVGMVKAPFMALIIGLVACMEGFRVQGSAESLGAHVTASVVKAIFLVIVADGLFAMYFTAIDM